MDEYDKDAIIAQANTLVSLWNIIWPELIKRVDCGDFHTVYYRIRHDGLRDSRDVQYRVDNNMTDLWSQKRIGDLFIMTQLAKLYIAWYDLEHRQ